MLNLFFYCSKIVLDTGQAVACTYNVVGFDIAALSFVCGASNNAQVCLATWYTQHHPIAIIEAL
jgi:hypothetical protein